jgi:hypothetical protein
VPKPVTVFSAKTDRYYQVYRQGSDLYQSAFQLDKKGHKIFEIAHRLDYVVGGGLTGYSYLFRVGQWFFQAPLSYYSENGQWDLSPGYNADDIGFTRPISTACLSCHNGQPISVPKRDGMYREPYFRFGELAISCESCHGPGQLHIEEMNKRKGQPEARAAEPDTSIVNPARLSPSLADDLCMDCHQSGDAVVLMPGKDFLDYRPGTPLSQTMAIFRRPLKEEQRAEANRLETQPPVRGSLEAPLWWKNSSLRLSRCYQESRGRLTCIICHVIHHPPSAEDRVEHYRNKCLGCHSPTSCRMTVDDRRREQPGDDCVACHMEKRAVAGIAHSNDTKHRIVRTPGQPLPDAAFEKPKPDLPGLLWLNRPPDEEAHPLPLATMLQAYWTVSKNDPSLKKYCVAILDELGRSAPNEPVVLHGRGAIALAEKKDFAARDYYAQALKIGSEELITFLYLSTALDNLGHDDEAEQVLERGVAAYPYSATLRAKLARQYLHDGKAWRARVVVNEYLKVFPEEPTLREVLKEVQASGQ